MTRPKNFDERKMMEKSIVVMKQSVHEKREDGKICPSVGAVLVKPDGTVISACRGELRLGDHAEYTLLERKMHDDKCEGSLLFTTLEPCTSQSRNGQYLPQLLQQIFDDKGKDLDKIEKFVEGARRHKTGCAQRIIDAQIKEVWVGIEDPNVDIDGGGIKLLEKNNIKVHMYQKDLQIEIRKFNIKFLEQAGSTREKSMFVQGQVSEFLSFDNPLMGFSFADLSTEALRFLAKETKQKNISSKSFFEFLLQKGILIKVGNDVVVTNIGYLLFGKEPHSRFPQAGLSLTIKLNNGKEIIENFFIPQILIPAELEKYLKNKFPEFIDRTTMVHNRVQEIPIELIRESVVNALIHRDYSIQGAICNLLITEDRFEIKSPGRPVSQISLEQLNAFNAPMIYRNPQIAYLFSLCHLAEQRGFGMNTFKLAEEKYSIPKPFYKFEDPYLVLTIYRTQSAFLSAIPVDLIDQFSVYDRVKLQKLFNQGEFSREQYKNLFNLSDSTALRQIRVLVSSGVLTQIGAGPSVKYIFIRK